MVMLYLCRHGIAEDLHGKMQDADRRLTREGCRKFRKGARGLVKFLGDHAIAGILSSPLLRARETADILADCADVDVTVTETLAPPGDLPGLLRHGRRLTAGRKGGIVAVGHEPILGDWIGELCFSGHGRVELKKGAVAAIELAPGKSRGDLRWILPPAALRELR